MAQRVQGLVWRQALERAQGLPPRVTDPVQRPALPARSAVWALAVASPNASHSVAKARIRVWRREQGMV